MHLGPGLGQGLGGACAGLTSHGEVVDAVACDVMNRPGEHTRTRRRNRPAKCISRRDPGSGIKKA